MTNAMNVASARPVRMMQIGNTTNIAFSITDKRTRQMAFQRN